MNTGWWLGVSPSGVTGTTKRTVVPLAPAPVQFGSAVFGSTPIVPSAHTTPSISGSWSVPSVAASGVVNATVTGAPLPVAIGCGASAQSPPAVVQSVNAQSSVAGALGPATIHDTDAASPGDTSARPGSAATSTRAPSTRVRSSCDATGRSLLQPAISSIAAMAPEHQGDGDGNDALFFHVGAHGFS